MQTEAKKDLEFHQETDTFNLTVTFNDSTLTITLKDLVDWVIYSNWYTEDDVGQQIHKKMDLMDVYSAFHESRHIDDKAKEGGVAQLKHYEFGTVVEN